ncbi:MAG: M23 family metallopeptidase [Acidobacteriota bacterium]
MERNILKIVFLILSAILLSGENEKYRWPLSINNGYSSSFQEFRGNHFHGGIDLRTFQKTGYPVYAVHSGFITKLRYVKRGSGKGIYIKHSNGNTSIYFHLNRFTKKIENVLTNIQRKKRKKYIGNYFFSSPVKVNRGEIIGYSGETGSGFPHLHFEVRDKDGYALNPFKLIRFIARDTNFPVMKGIFLRSIGETSVNGKIGKSYFKFKRSNNSFYLEDPVLVSGEFEMVLNTSDIADTGKTVSPHKIELFLNEKNVFRLIFEKFSYNENNQLGFVYDMFYSSASSYFFNIFSQKGYDLEKKKFNTKLLYENLHEGNNKVKLAASDNFGNTSTAVFNIYKYNSPDITISKPEISENILRVKLEKFKPSGSDNIIINLYDKEQKLIFTGNPEIKTLLEKKILLLRGVNKKIIFYEFLFKRKNIILNRKKFSFDNNKLGRTSDIKFSRYINRDKVIVKIDDKNITSNNIILEVVQGKERKKVYPGSDKENITFSFKPMNNNNVTMLNFSIINNGKVVAYVQKKLFLVYLKNGITNKSQYDEFNAYFASNSVKEDKVLSLDITNYESDYPSESQQVKLYPYSFPFLDTVYYKFKKKLPNPDQVGIFKYSLKSKKWYYKYTTYNRTENIFRTRLISSGIFSLMRDIFPPEIIFMKASKSINFISRINVKIRDKGKGVNDDTIKAILNGKYPEHEYDPDWNLLKIENIKKLIRKGKNILKIYVEDRAGNVSIKERAFYLR